MPNTQIFSKVNEVPAHYWLLLNNENSLHFNPKFLKAYEIGNPNIIFNYIFVLKENKPIAFAYTQLVSIKIETLTKNTTLPSWLKYLANRLFCYKSLKILFCGNVFLSGEYGIYYSPKADSKSCLNVLAKVLYTQAKQIKGLYFIFIKDFLNSTSALTKNLLKYKYTPIVVEPNMVINIKPQWHNFETYKLALKSKYRIKANNADNKSELLKATFFSLKDLETYKNQLQWLYENTIANANFNAQVLNLDTYIYLKSAFTEDFYVKGYFYKEALVGFMAGLKHGAILEAHFIGIDYTKNKDLAIYPRILNDYIRLGITLKVAKINLGRTASEIKSTLGAMPENLICYGKHPNPFLNWLLKPFIKKIKVKRFKQHQPFKSGHI